MNRICIVQPALNAVSETFIRAHGELLPGVVGIVHSREGRLFLGEHPLPARDRFSRAWLAVARVAGLCPPWRDKELALRAAFRRTGAAVVLAEYGFTAVKVLGACRKAGLPLVAHFHGYDASELAVVRKYRDGYRAVFDQAAAVVAVSRAMEQQLLSLGCPRDKLVRNPYGVDCDRFQGARPADAPATFVGVGRLVEKKAPYLTLVAFAAVLKECPQARLRLIGDGPLLGVCRDLARALGIEPAVTFLGSQPHDVVRREMRQARAFVQHSIVASSGDSEGTPVSVLEAGAMGLPVVATRHAGITDVVVENETGLLVDEKDVEGMARHLRALAGDPGFAGELGRNAAAHLRRFCTMDHSLRRLARVLEAAANRQDMAAVRAELEAELPSPQPTAAGAARLRGTAGP